MEARVGLLRLGDDVAQPRLVFTIASACFFAAARSSPLVIASVFGSPGTCLLDTLISSVLQVYEIEPAERDLT